MMLPVFMASCQASPAPPLPVSDAASDQITIRGTEHPVNALVVKALNDIIGFWKDDKPLDPAFTSPHMFVSVNSPNQRSRGCHSDVVFVNYCEDGIVWNAENVSKIHDLAGEFSVTFMVADAIGMYTQRQQGLPTSYESAADCLSGVYFHYVDNGYSNTYPEASSKDTAVGVGAGLVALTGVRTAENEDITDSVLETRTDAVVYGLSGTSQACLERYGKSS
jgi:hypothetical protein